MWLGKAWKQYCAEHGVLADGKNPDTWHDGSFRCFFEETHGVLFIPRNLSVDLELNVIDDIRNGDLAIYFILNFYQMVKKLLQTILLCGHWTVGKEITDKVNTEWEN